MKLAAIFNVFDGEELLIGSIEQIYPYIDELIIIYQTRSNFGEYHNNSIVISYIENKYNCITHKYTPTYLIKDIGASNEKIKRTIGLEFAQNRGCTHFLFMDCDEFYDVKQFQQAKKTIESNKYDATACRLYTYYKKPEYQLTPMESYYVPFICEIKKDMVVGAKFPVYADPTRGVSPVNNFYEFGVDEIAMHHYSYIRNDIAKKLRNSSARGNFKDIEGMIEQFNNWQLGDEMIHFTDYQIEVVQNQFNI